MGFLNRLFAAKKVEPKHIFPTRPLQLKSRPVAENGKSLAQDFIDVVKDNDDIELDLSVDSLIFIDNFLEDYSKELAVDDFAETIFVAGCYCGQVMVENANGIWINLKDAQLPEGINMMPIVMKMPNGSICDPIGKAFKRFGNGEVDSVVFFYQAFTRQG